jgi:HEAT repeat protein
MTHLFKQGFVCLAFLAMFVVGSKALAEDSHDSKLIAELASDDPRTVRNALDDLADESRPSTNVLLAVRKLLPDPRPSVRTKAARVLGALHAEVDSNDIKAICSMLKSYDQREEDDALKALRDLHASESVSEITPLLKSSHILIVRDACRTLAVLGNKDVIVSIEPLLNHPDGNVRKDAQAAIVALRAKP